jgi:hypothetical protein
MTTTELILICALLGWMAFAFAIVVLLDVVVGRAKTWRIRALQSRARSERRPELAPPPA